MRFGDVDAIVVNAAGCGSHLKERRAAGAGRRRQRASRRARARGAERNELPLRVAYQDACHLGHAQGIRDAPRSVLRAIPGLELVEPAEQAICCGSAGIYNLLQPAAAAELGERKAANVAATGAEAYASANPGCLVQVSAYLRQAGQPLPALHPVELVDASIRGVGRERCSAQLGAEGV